MSVVAALAGPVRAPCEVRVKSTPAKRRPPRWKRSDSRCGQCRPRPPGQLPLPDHLDGTRGTPLNEITMTIVGNLTDDPELRFTPSGAAVCRFRVAHTPRYFDKPSGEWKEGESTFLDCSAWRDLAEHLAESLKKGMRVILLGNFKTHRWESTGTGKTPAGETITRSVVDVVACGPELTYATASVQKVKRTRAGETAPDDPWASASKTRPPAGARSTSFDDEPPF